MGSFDIAKTVNMPFLGDNLGAVEAKLATVIPTGGPLRAPIKRVVESPSKRLRSALVLAAANSSKSIDEKVVRACTAIELLHLGSLVHDDIMDKSETRWNGPTVYAEEGVNTAILVGDYLFAKANLLASSISQEVAEIIATTIINLCEGQATELADTGNLRRTIDNYHKAIAGKTGSLLAAACTVGGLCGGVNKQTAVALGSFGESFGVAYQLLDDVLDIISTEALLGKPVGTDLKEGIYTMPALLTVQDNPKLTPDKINPELLVQSGSVKKTVELSKQYNQKARTALKNTEYSALSELPDKYFEWAMKNYLENNLSVG
ncbi:MAG: polyprenyl synthetase family protein [Methylophilus sp.]